MTDSDAVSEGRGDSSGWIERSPIIKNSETPEDNKVVIAGITVYFPEKEIQNQRHEVCLKYKRFGVMEHWGTGVME